MCYWLLKLISKIGDSIIDKLASYLAGAIILAVLIIVFFFRKGLAYQLTVTLSLWALILLGVIIALLPILFYHWLSRVGRRPFLRNENDIRNAIEEWVNYLRPSTCIGLKYYFSAVDKRLGLKRGSSRRLLPQIAQKHKYGLRAGKKTFIFENLTEKNNMPNALGKLLRSKNVEGRKEFELDCRELADRVAWPLEAVMDSLLAKKKDDAPFKIMKVARDRVKITIMELVL
jgi:hypothetical protein